MNDKKEQDLASNTDPIIVAASYKLENFLHEFDGLLERYNACIVRSASEKGNLVVSVIDGLIIHEAEFKEEISHKDISNKHYDKESY